jgi:hypothetical protein
MHNLIKIGLGLSLAIVYPFMVGFGIEAFYEPPKQPYEVCRSVMPIPEGTQPTKDPGDPMNNPTYKRCYDESQTKVDIYNRNIFLITTAFGFIAITFGTLLFSEKMGPVGPGLVFGGLFTILYGTMRSFRSLDKQWIFLELLVVFIGLILVTWRFLRVSQKK